MEAENTLSTDAAVKMARACGFDHVSELNVSSLTFEQAVRDMCAAGRCGSYGKNWCCPPACGTLEEAAEKASAYHRGLLLQSTGRMEDDFDIETMMETEKRQKKRFYELTGQIRAVLPACLPMSSGTCTVCGSCAYPQPCRYPDRKIPSMEAYGLNVTAVCLASGAKYYYGPRTITYTACILLD